MPLLSSYGGDQGTGPCDTGFYARVWVTEIGHFARQIQWHRRPDGLIGIQVNQNNFNTNKVTPIIRPIFQVEIRCQQGHTYKLHPWEVIECEGLSLPVPLQ